MWRSHATVHRGRRVQENSRRGIRDTEDAENTAGRKDRISDLINISSHFAVSCRVIRVQRVFVHSEMGCGRSSRHAIRSTHGKNLRRTRKLSGAESASPIRKSGCGEARDVSLSCAVHWSSRPTTPESWVRKNPLTPSLSPQNRGSRREGTRIAHRANGSAIRNPSCDANANPLTPSLSPQSRGEGAVQPTILA